MYGGALHFMNPAWRPPWIALAWRPDGFAIRR